MTIKNFCFFIFSLLLLLFLACKNEKKIKEINFSKDIYKTTKPLTRWWWFADNIKKQDITYQLDLLKEKNFGGVEIAWVYPLSRKRFSKGTDTIFTERYKWLGENWQDIVVFTKQYCDSIGLHCDFTFGTGWPFGDSYVDYENSTQVYNAANDDYKKTYSVSWEHPKKGYIINHLSKKAFDSYAKKMGNALKPALKGEKSCLFCDSWEVETRKIWTEGFAEKFKHKFGYDIIPYMDNIYDPQNADIHYDYLKLVSEYVIENFYKPFTKWANKNNSFTRTQCSGAPVDILTAYASQDVPESEAMLYEPSFSLIPLSAAVLSGKKTITAESFTCTYGFPSKNDNGKIDNKYLKQEQTADLKLVADALFANGVNQIIWHGKPFNGKGVDSVSFYATVHVGKAGNLWNEISEFNNYLSKVCKYLRAGKTYSEIAVYIPQEDAWTGQKLDNPDPQMPWAWGEYEMRYVRFAKELRGYHPLWINNYFLEKADFQNGSLKIGDASFSLLYIDVNFLDFQALKTIYNLAKRGLKVCLKAKPEQAGFKKTSEYDKILQKLLKLENVKTNFKEIYTKKPLVSGENLPDFICKIYDNNHYIFFANYKAQDLHLPLEYGQSYSDKTISLPVLFSIDGKTKHYNIVFEPYQSVLLKIDENFNIKKIDIEFVPETPEKA